MSVKEAEQWATQYLQDEFGGQEIKIMEASPHDDGIRLGGRYTDKDGKWKFELIFNVHGELVSKKIEPIVTPHVAFTKGRG